MNSKVSVLMGVYNGRPYLKESIESVLSQTFTDFEFLIIDDASTDKSPEIVKEYAERDSRVRLVNNDTNRGLTWSLNRALKLAKGDYIARQDADDRSAPTRFERQVSYLDEHPNTAVVGTGARLIDENGETIDRRVGLEAPSLADLQSKNHIIHGSILARRRDIMEVDGYDNFFEYSQDYDLWLRLAETKDVRNIPAPLYELREHQESIYFDKMERSTLYAFLALGQSTGKIDSQTIEKVRLDGIDTLYDRMSDVCRGEFHRVIAQTYLRYGHLAQARVDAKKAWKILAGDSATLVLYLLTFTHPQLLSGLRRMVRKYMNMKTRLRNVT